MYQETLHRLEESVSEALEQMDDRGTIDAAYEGARIASIADPDAPESTLRAVRNTIFDYQEGEPRPVPIVDGEPYGMGITFAVTEDFSSAQFDAMTEELYQSVKDEHAGVMGTLVSKPMARLFRSGLQRQYVASGQYRTFSLQFVEADKENYIVMGSVGGWRGDYEETFAEAEQIATYLDEQGG